MIQTSSLFLENKRPRPASPWFYLYLPRKEALLSRMCKSSVLAQIFLSICRSFVFTGGLGSENFWGSDLTHYKYFWLPPQNIWGFEYLEDFVSLLPIKFISTSFLSNHKHFYPEYGLTEYDLLPYSPMDLSFAVNSNPMDSPTFFMLMVEPAPKKIPLTFFIPSFHYQQYSDKEPMETSEVEEAGSSSWKALLAVFTHPREGEEVDYIFPWRFDHERSVMSLEMKRKLQSKHVFQHTPISYQMSKQPLSLT